jgi:hypothetical protein
VNPDKSTLLPSRKLPDELEKVLENNRGSIPSKVYGRLIEVLQDLRDDDFSEIKLETLMREIISEYEND